MKNLLNKVLKISVLAALIVAVNVGKAIASNDPELPNPTTVCGQDTSICQKQEFVKNFNHSFTVGKNALVVLSNKYGRIDVKTNNGNQAAVNVRVVVNATDENEANKIFARINIAFTEGGDFVKAETQIETQSNSRIWDVLNGKSCGDFHIDYDVTMPATNRLDLSNKYGNSTVGTLQNSVKIDQRYGDFRLDGATIAMVQLAYGGGEMGNLTALNGSVSYGRLTSPMIKDVQLRSKYSNFKFDHVGSLDIQSAYDDYDVTSVSALKTDAQYGNIVVGSVDNLSAAGSYTTFKIKKVEQNADFKTVYGEIRIASVKAGFGTINVVGKQTDCLIAVDPSVSYQLDVVGAYTDLQSSATLKPKVDREERYRREVMGTVGNPNTKSVIRAQMSYGSFRIK